MSFVAPTLQRSRVFCRRNHFAPKIRHFTRATNLVMMPEGPEVRTLVRQLQAGVGRRLVDLRFVSGRYVNNGKPRGFEAFAPTMTPFEKDPGKFDIITSIQCKGKFIYMLLGQAQEPDYQRSIWITLGMTGRFLSEEESSAREETPRWYMDLMDFETGKRNKIMYHDRRNFGTLRFSLSGQELVEKLQSLGPDIFSLSEEEFETILSTAKQETNVSKFLMIQSNLCGIGNYLLAEGLYRAGVDPYASIGEIEDWQRRVLFRELKAATEESFASLNGEDDFEMQCYGREFCVKGKPVRRDTDGPHGRTIHYIDDQLIKPVHERKQSAINTLASPKVRSVAKPGVPLEDTLTDESWKTVLSPFFETTEFENIKSFLESEYVEGATVYPPHDQIFAALNACPFDKVKCVIVGQDPYHGPGQAHGFAFSVQKGVEPPPSLKNIFKEVTNDVGIDAPKHGNLESWAQQGVLLLNTVLTVRRGEANSHSKIGWEKFTDFIIEKLDSEREGLVFLLWGRPAQTKAKTVDDTKHTIIRTSHPSPLGATKTDSPFLGSRCFSRTNHVLSGEPIDWNIH